MATPKIDNTMVLMPNGSLMKVESIAMIGLGNHFLIFLRVAVLHKFTVYKIMV